MVFNDVGFNPQKRLILLQACYQCKPKVWEAIDKKLDFPYLCLNCRKLVWFKLQRANTSVVK